MLISLPSFPPLPSFLFPVPITARRTGHLPPLISLPWATPLLPTLPLTPLSQRRRSHPCMRWSSGHLDMQPSPLASWVLFVTVVGLDAADPMVPMPLPSPRPTSPTLSASSPIPSVHVPQLSVTSSACLQPPYRPVVTLTATFPSPLPSPHKQRCRLLASTVQQR